jgi:hypothetical protein
MLLTGFDLEEGRLRMAAYAPGGLIHLEEVSDPDVVSVCVRRLAAREGEGQIAILSGDRRLIQEVSERFSDDETTDCLSIADCGGRNGGRVSLSGELAGKEHLLPEVFAAAGMDVRRGRASDYLRGGRERRVFADTTRLICVLAVIFALLLSSMLPVYERLLRAETETGRATVEKQPYAEVRPELKRYRDLLAELRSYGPGERLLESRESRFAALLSELNGELLAGAEISEIVYDEQTGLLIDFTTSRVDDFNRIKNRINDSGRMNVVETAEREVVGEGIYRVQAEVVFPEGREGDGA